MRYGLAVALAGCVSSMLAADASVLPMQWGEHVSGVVTRFATHRPQVALTFDACGGSVKSSQLDERLITFLIAQKIPATLFINARWIDSNPEKFLALAANPLFEIENHGTAHRPLSVNGRSVYGIEGTHSPDEVRSEILGNEEKIARLTGRKPLFFRSGTAYYDEIATAEAARLGVKIAGFSVVGDAGATLPSAEVAKRIGEATSGEIVIAHMNHPESGTADGVMAGVRRLKERGFEFVRLEDVAGSLVTIP